MPGPPPYPTNPKPAPSPKELAEEARTALKAGADPRRAEGSQRYFKDAVKVMGWQAAELRGLAKATLLKVKTGWTVDQAAALCDILYPNPYLEAKALATIVLAGFIRSAPAKLFPKLRSWLEADRLDNWASTDIFCGEVLSSFLDHNPELWEKLKEWTRAKNMWVRRASAVTLVTPARRGRCLDLAYDVARRLFSDREDLIHKATGWLLREAGKTDMPRLENFLRRHGPQIPRTALRYAIERFDHGKRKMLLRATSAR